MQPPSGWPEGGARLRGAAALARMIKGIALRCTVVALACIVVPKSAMRAGQIALRLHCQFIGKWAGVGWNGVIEAAAAEPELWLSADEESDLCGAWLLASWPRSAPTWLMAWATAR
jgi:hypothetical protein